MFRTSDIVFAAFLRSSGLPLLKIEMEGPRGTFIFDEVPDALVMEFDLGNARVEPNRFNGIIRELSAACVRSNRNARTR
jgi:hypothetical protein